MNATPTARGVRAALAAALLAGGLATPAAATPPGQEYWCTREPRSSWMPEEQIRRIFGEEKYAVVKFKVSRTNCYEFYAIRKEGGIVEAYYHPVTGKLVKETRVGEPGAPRR